MTASVLTTSPIDPTAIFEHFRGSYSTELLTAAVSAFDVFGRLASGPRSETDLRREIGLEARPAVVLFTALKAMKLLSTAGDGRLQLTPMSREHLLSGSPFDVSDYIRLAAESPGVKEMIARLRTNRPAEIASEKGAAFIFREGIESAMEREASARSLTLALAGRAKNVAPSLARAVDLNSSRTLLDVGGGTGIYSIACLLANPRLRAIVWDRPDVLRVAGEMADAYGVADRIDLLPGDMFVDPVPAADAMLISNVLHDWDEPECRRLIQRCSNRLSSGGRLIIHDVFLNDAMDGPLPIALYSAALFSITEGRAYSAGEYRQWLSEAALESRDVVPTLVHCGVLEGVKK
jgi:predicted O-methyltransferase YrrM